MAFEDNAKDYDSLASQKNNNNNGHDNNQSQKRRRHEYVQIRRVLAKNLSCSIAATGYGIVFAELGGIL